MVSPLTGFVNIGPRTSLFTPSKPTDGQLIIICTWLGAARKHIAKYATLYQKIAPGARILLIESNVGILISTYVRQRNDIKPAVSAVLDSLAECDYFPVLDEESIASSTGQVLNGHCNGSIRSSRSSTGTSTPKPHPRIILHTFSNGGTNTATQLLLVLRSRLRSPLPLAGLLCDSCPAKGTYWKSYDAMVLSLPKDLASRILGALACHCILILLYSWIACGNENPASLNRRTMIGSEIVEKGWEDDGNLKKDLAADESGKGRVCYFYSKEDRMCQWTDVNDHADEARKRGWEVKEVVFDGSGHCAHFSMDEKKYCEAVKSIWDGVGGGWVKHPTPKL